MHVVKLDYKYPCYAGFEFRREPAAQPAGAALRRLRELEQLRQCVLRRISGLEVLAHFFKTGELKVQLSCTEQLQTFKWLSKAHVGPPVKVQNLGKGGPDYNPRPERFRNVPNYTDLVHNETITMLLNQIRTSQ